MCAHTVPARDSLDEKSLRQHQAFTLTELLVVIAIIALLAALLFPAVIITQDSMDRAKTVDLIQGLQQALLTETVSGAECPLPDNLVPPTDPAAQRIGFLIFDPMDSRPGIVNAMVDGQDFNFDFSGMTNEDHLLIDSWGNPIHYVLGDFKNRKDSAGYDPLLPQDLNKPKDADKPALHSDWNRADRGKFPYIYSEGPEQIPETWIYYTQ